MPQPYDPSNNDLEVVGDLNNSELLENKEEITPKEKVEIVEKVEKDTKELFDQKLSSLNNRYSESVTNCFVNNNIKKKYFTNNDVL